MNPQKNSKWYFKGSKERKTTCLIKFKISHYNRYVYVISFENHINDGNLWQVFNMSFEKCNWKIIGFNSKFSLNYELLKLNKYSIRFNSSLGKGPLNYVNINFLTFKKLGDRKFLIDFKDHIPLTYLSPLHLTFATILNFWLHFHHVLTFSPLLTFVLL
jgi:hypothetical protein